MRIDQKIWTSEKGWTPDLSGRADETVHLVLFFGPPNINKENSLKEINKLIRMPIFVDVQQQVKLPEHRLLIMHLL